MYRLTSKKPEREGSILYYSNSYFNVDDATKSTTLRIVDDTSLPADTLSRRRLILQSRGVDLYPLRRAIFFLGDFLKMAKSGYWFMDSYGKLFTYKKTRRVKLTFKRITKIIPSAHTGSIIEVEGIPQRFKCLYIVYPYESKYAGILEFNKMQIFYGTYPIKYRDSWRLI